MWLCAVVMMSAAGEVAAQIRIIPQSQIDSIKNPATVATSAMRFSGGNQISLGKIAEEDGIWSQTIEWQNVGKQPLVITRTSSSCSCLVIETERTPVQAGGKSSVTLRYNPHNRSGRVSQRVMIYTNLSDKTPTAVLTLEGEVRPKAYRADDYPHLRGSLALRRDTVAVAPNTEVRVACMNVGKSALRLSADSLMSDRGVRMFTEPRELKAGEEGDMVIWYNPATATKSGILRLYIAGLQLPPRQRCLVLKIAE